MVEFFGPEDKGYEDLKEVNRLLLNNGSQLILLMQPTRGLAHPEHIDESTTGFNWRRAKNNYQSMIENLKEIGLLVVDMSDILPYKKNNQSYFFKRDHHWSIHGANISAKKVADIIKKNPAYQSISNFPVVLEKSGLMKSQGTLQSAVRQLCDFDYPSEYFSQFTVSTEEAEIDENSLFEDDLPEIVLVGTSNSTETYNFPQALMYELQKDVLNVAIKGGGYNGSLMQYLLSDEYRDTPPKFIIWEVPSYYRLSAKNFYRQIHPMIKDGCRSKDILLEDNKKLMSGVNEILFNGGDTPILQKGDNLLLDLTFDNEEVKQVDTTIWYANGRKEEINFKIPERANTGGRFMINLKDNGDYANFSYLSMDIHIDPQKNVTVPTEVTAQLCLR